MYVNGIVYRKYLELSTCFIQFKTRSIARSTFASTNTITWNISCGCSEWSKKEQNHRIIVCVSLEQRQLTFDSLNHNTNWFMLWREKVWNSSLEFELLQTHFWAANSTLTYNLPWMQNIRYGTHINVWWQTRPAPRTQRNDRTERDHLRILSIKSTYPSHWNLIQWLQTTDPFKSYNNFSHLIKF